MELQRAGHLGDDRVGVRIPGGQLLARLHLVAVVDGDGGAVGDLVALTLAAELVHHADLAGARHRDPVALGVLARS